MATSFVIIKQLFLININCQIILSDYWSYDSDWVLAGHMIQPKLHIVKWGDLRSIS